MFHQQLLLDNAEYPVKLKPFKTLKNISSLGDHLSVPRKQLDSFYDLASPLAKLEHHWKAWYLIIIRLHEGSNFDYLDIFKSADQILI